VSRPGSEQRGLRVIKLGGSLLPLPDLAERFRRWRERLPARRDVVVVGGGPFVDRLRQLDRGNGLGPRRAHDLAIEAMGLTARLVACLLPAAEVVCDHARLLQDSDPARLTLFDAGRFLRDVEPRLPGTRLEIGWHVTSDSIAARLAIALQAEELVLLKSAPPPRGATLEGWARVGYVDAFLPRLAAELPPLRIVDLRSPPTETAAPIETGGRANLPP